MPNILVRGVHAVLFAVMFSLCLGVAHAAGDWEWTKGQGWMMGAGVSRPTAKEQLHYAYQLEQRGEFMDSARQYFLLIQNFPDSQEAGIGLQRLAKCLFEMENYYTAYKAVEQVIKTYPNTGQISDLVEIELRIGKKMMLSDTPDLIGGTDNTRASNVKRAIEIVDSVIEHDPYGPVAAEAYLVKGEGHLFVGELNDARTAFDKVMNDFPRSDFVERARLGLLRCDQMVGQARPQEVYEQAQLVREAEEARRQQAGVGEDEFDDVGESIKQMSEVEAGKMMEQANQYRQMGTRAAVKSSEFLYKEIARRFPGTPQADEANERLGKLKIPREQGRLAQSIRAINLNPFTWNKDPEPPWIVPQIDPEDQVMVDSGLGPILGVPEIGPPSTAGAAGLRPAALAGSASVGTDDAPFSPADAAPTMSSSGGYTPAPPFVDASAGYGQERVYSSAPQPTAPTSGYSEIIPAPPGMADLGPSRTSALYANNPLPSISEDDLISFDRHSQTMTSSPQQPLVFQPSTRGGDVDYTSPAPVQQEYQTYQSPPPEPRIGSQYDIPLSDLVGSMGSSSGSSYAAPPPQPNYSQPVYPEPAYSQPQQYYAPAPEHYAPAPAGQPFPEYQDLVVPSASGQGNWTMGDDFR